MHTPSIDLQNVAVRFRLYHNRRPALKDVVLNAALRQNRHERTDFYALRDINLTINAGDRVGVLGLNGAGKTTLLKTIAGVYTAQSGTVKTTGRITPLIELGAGFNVEFSGRENIYLNAAIYGYTNREIDARVNDIIAFAELAEFIDQPMKYFSAGMMARLSFSIVTAFDPPDILLSDEVLATGDARFVHKALERMHVMLASSGIVVFVSHSVEQVIELCNRAIILHRGQLMAQGDTREMAHLYYSQYAGLAQAPTPL